MYHHFNQITVLAIAPCKPNMCLTKITFLLGTPYLLPTTLHLSPQLQPHFSASSSPGPLPSYLTLSGGGKRIACLPCKSPHTAEDLLVWVSQHMNNMNILHLGIQGECSLLLWRKEGATLQTYQGLGSQFQWRENLNKVGRYEWATLQLPFWSVCHYACHFSHFVSPHVISHDPLDF